MDKQRKNIIQLTYTDIYNDILIEFRKYFPTQTICYNIKNDNLVINMTCYNKNTCKLIITPESIAERYGCKNYEWVDITPTIFDDDCGTVINKQDTETVLQIW